MRVRPLSLLVLLAFTALPRAGRAYDYFEHRWMGDAACAVAAGVPGARLRCALTPEGVVPEEALTFGDLVAMAGDHVGTPEALALAVRAYLKELGACRMEICPRAQRTLVGRVLRVRELQARGVRRWVGDNARGAARDLSACASATPWPGLPARPGQGRVYGPLPPGMPADEPGRACHDALASALAEMREQARQKAVVLSVKGDCYTPAEPEMGEFARLPDYASLASGNYTHFGKDALSQWWSLHREARRRSDLEALVHEAFALHFLTDRFSSGHIRTPRGDLSNIQSLWRHDFDNLYGLLVRGRIGVLPVEWNSLGDRCLLGHGGEPSRVLAVLSSVRSLGQLAGERIAGVPSIGAPELIPNRNPSVPKDSRILGLTLEPFTSYVHDPGGWLFGGAAGTGARLTYHFNAGRWWSPPSLHQAFFQLSSGHQIYVPIAVEFWHTLIMTTVAPLLIASYGAERGGAEALRVRELLDSSLLPFGWLKLSFNVYLGLAIVSGAGLPASPPPEFPSPVSLYGGVELRWRMFERWSLALHAEWMRLVSVGLGLGLEM